MKGQRLVMSAIVLEDTPDERARVVEQCRAVLAKNGKAILDTSPTVECRETDALRRFRSLTVTFDHLPPVGPWADTFLPRRKRRFR